MNELVKLDAQSLENFGISSGNIGRFAGVVGELIERLAGGRQARFALADTSLSCIAFFETDELPCARTQTEVAAPVVLLQQVIATFCTGSAE